MEIGKNHPPIYEGKIHKDLLQSCIFIDQNKDLTPDELAFIFSGEAVAIKDILKLGCSNTTQPTENLKQQGDIT